MLLRGLLPDRRQILVHVDSGSYELDLLWYELVSSCFTLSRAYLIAAGTDRPEYTPYGLIE